MSGTAARRWRIATLALTLIVALSCAAYAQRGRFYGWGGGRDLDVENVPYDGRFTFARLNTPPRPAATGIRGCRHGRTAIRSPKTT